MNNIISNLYPTALQLDRVDHYLVLDRYTHKQFIFWKNEDGSLELDGIIMKELVNE